MDRAIVHSGQTVSLCMAGPELNGCTAGAVGLSAVEIDSVVGFMGLSWIMLR